MHPITAPDPRSLLPPLLACLPTAFVSPRPPPALLPLLSPILRQRVTLLSGSNNNNTTTTSSNGGWLNLLSWNTSVASKLGPKIEGLQLEPHPSSGELELEDVEKTEFRRLDEETLQACLFVQEFGLAPIYVWCENDEHGNTGPGWLLAELRALEDIEAGTWFSSIGAADDVFESATPQQQQQQQKPQTPAQDMEEDDEDDDDYWASYDRTPGRTPAAHTPAKRPSPAPASLKTTSSANNLPSASELEYFARYATEVQPALDSHDPDEEDPSTANSTLQGNTLQDSAPLANNNPTPPMYDSATPNQQLSAPRPTSPSSQSSVEKLEEQAQDMSRAEIGVKQFVSTEIKSMFRLARSVGMGRAEFERIVKTELDVLGMLEADD